MKKVTLIVLVFISNYTFSQVGIGTTTPNASLEIKASSPAAPSNTDGILIPRVDTFPSVDPTVAQHGILVFLTIAFPNFPVGFYFWDNNATAWRQMDTGESYWKLSGNAGTINGTDFIGTRDAKNLDIRVNNVIQARITTKGQIETFNNGESVFIGEGAGNARIGANNNVFVGYQVGLLNKFGNNNSAIGANSFHQNIGGNDNTAIGFNAMYNNTGGHSNTANGTNALYNNLTGDYNVANGVNALYANTGNNNTAIGAEALDHNTTGDNNIALGYRAGNNISTGSGNIIIGNDVDAPSATADNQLNIGNIIFANNVDGIGTNVSSGNVGIGIKNPVEKLEIDGAIWLNNSSGTDASGTIRWSGYDFEGYDGNEWLSLTRSNSIWGNSIPKSEENQIVTGSDTVVGDWFGSAVAISGDYAVIGAIYADVGGNNDQGAAYVFKRDGDIWTQQAKITADDGLANDQFGNAVSIWNDTTNDTTYIVVGAHLDDIGAYSDQGSAYVFKRSGTIWSQSDKFIASGQSSSLFGESVSLYGTDIAIGRSAEDVGGNNDQGAVYIYRRSGDSWGLRTKITASDGATSDTFGSSVSIYPYGTRCYVLIGAPNCDIGANNDQGAAYFYTRDNSWGQENKVEASDGEAGDLFGSAVSMWKFHAIIGSKNDDTAGEVNQGAAYLFLAPAYNIVGELGKYSYAYGKTDDLYGNAVAISEDTCIIGAYKDDIVSNSNQGSSFIYSIFNHSLELESMFTSSDGAANDQFGNSLAIDGNYAIVGAANKEQAYFINR